LEKFTPTLQGKSADISAFAFNADAAMKMGAGKIKAALLYASGDNSKTDYNGFVTGNQYSNGADLPLMQNDLYLILRTLDDISHSAAFFEDIKK
jgi:vancomycin permeability regulator SanA